MENRNKSLKTLFALPLVFSAALLSFAHGANDVANAVGPLAAIVHATEYGDFADKVAIPSWVMVIGAFGISFGLFLFGPKLIRMVGSQITKLNPMRAYLRGAVGGDHGDRGQLAGPAGQLDPYRGGRRLRRRLFPRMAHGAPAATDRAPSPRSSASPRRSAAGESWCGARIS